MDEAARAPRHVHLRHTIHVRGDPDAVLRLLTPEGERLWVPGWAPEYLDAPDVDAAPDLAEGVVFRTRHGGETTLWCVAEVDPAARRYAYHRYTPGSRAGVVTVACSGPAGGPTRVDVSYEMTGLSEAGDAILAAMSDGFTAEIDGWVEALEATLETGAAN
ncbi:MAG: SRPBCC family protein [Longimicrobiales bacterium]